MAEMTVVQEWAPLFTAGGVILGAVFGFFGAALNNRWNRKAQRRQAIADRLDDAYVALAETILAQPREERRFTPKVFVSYLADVEKWTVSLRSALAPIYVFGSQELVDLMYAESEEVLTLTNELHRAATSFGNKMYEFRDVTGPRVRDRARAGEFGDVSALSPDALNSLLQEKVDEAMAETREDTREDEATIVRSSRELENLSRKLLDKLGNEIVPKNLPIKKAT